MVKVSDVAGYLEELAPTAQKYDWDNVGLLVGCGEAPVERILISLDMTDAVIEEAVVEKAGLIVSHHPLFFSLKNVTEDDAAGRKVIKLIKNDISAICMHTNLDAAESGVNDALARAIGLHDTALLSVEGTGENGKPYGIGLFGRLTAPVSLNEFLAHVKKALQAKGLRYYDAGRGVCQVAVVGGFGGDELEQAVRTGCDTFLTADIKYHQFLQAKDLGINLIDGGHFCTENVIVPVLTEKLRSRFPGMDVMISMIHGQTDEYF